MTYCIPNLLILGLLLYRFTLPFSKENIIGAIFVGIFIIIIKKSMEMYLKKDVLGWGDVKLIGCCVLFLSFDQIGVFLIFIGILAIVIGIVFRLKIIPLAPAIWGGLMITKHIMPCIQNMIH